MHSTSLFLTLAFALTTSATPLLTKRQAIDTNAVNALPDPVIVEVPVGGGSQTVPVDPSAVTASVKAEVSADPLPQSKKRSLGSLVKRDCTAGPDDTAANFLADSTYSDAANSAATPDGYDLTYQNLQAASSAYGYLGYQTVETYDVASCAAACGSIYGCAAFNICMLSSLSLLPLLPFLYTF